MCIIYLGFALPRKYILILPLLFVYRESEREKKKGEMISDTLGYKILVGREVSSIRLDDKWEAKLESMI